MTNLNIDQRETIIGLLLGDGCVSSNGYFILTNTNLRFLKHIQARFKNLHLSIKRRDYRESDGKWVGYQYKTAYDLKFGTLDFTKKLRNLFYRDDVYGKVFPVLQLTSMMLRYWYVCDGSLNYRKDEKRRSAVIISSVNESKENISFSEFNFSPCLTQNGFAFGVNETAKLFQEIGYDPVPGFDYKWPKAKLLTDNERLEIISKIIEELREDFTLKEVGERLNINYHTVMNWEKGYTAPEHSKFKQILELTERKDNNGINRSNGKKS